MLEREECPNFINLKYVLALNFLLPMDAPHPAEKERMKKKNTEWKWATESLASGVGVGGRVTALQFIIKSAQSVCLSVRFPHAVNRWWKESNVYHHFDENKYL